MTDEQIKYMVDNARHGYPPQRHEPVGTNLLTACQATEMVRHMIEGMPKS